MRPTPWEPDLDLCAMPHEAFGAESSVCTLVIVLLCFPEEATRTEELW